MRVLVLAEYYPREGDAMSGVWAHRQALATRAAGADIRVLVLHRPIPPLASVRSLDWERAVAVVGQPREAILDGLQVDYLRYVSPPRALSYGSWGAWAAPPLARKLRAIRRQFAYDLIHAHYAVPAGDAARRGAPGTPLIISVHGHDVYGRGSRHRAVRTALRHARLVLANTAGTARRCTEHGARATRVVHLGADLSREPRAAATRVPTLVTVGNLVPRKRNEDVIRAIALLRERHQTLRHVIVGDGPERPRLEQLASDLSLDAVVEFRGRCSHEEAIATAQRSTLFVLPSVDEAFGVAYVEAMAGGVPAVGCRGEDGPEEIAAAGGGIELVPARDVRALAGCIDGLLSDEAGLAELGRRARTTVERRFTWEQCGRRTVAAYEEVLRGSSPASGTFAA